MTGVSGFGLCFGAGGLGTDGTATAQLPTGTWCEARSRGPNHPQLCRRHGERKVPSAFRRISPWENVVNKDVQMLIFNRAEDRCMRKENALHFQSYCHDRGIHGVQTEFIEVPGLPAPTIYPNHYRQPMLRFLFDS